MARITNIEEQVKRLQAAIESADRQLGLVLDSRSEYGYAATVCLAARRRLRAGLKDCGLQDQEPGPKEEPAGLYRNPTITEKIKWYRKK